MVGWEESFLPKPPAKLGMEILNLIEAVHSTFLRKEALAIASVLISLITSDVINLSEGALRLAKS